MIVAFNFNAWKDLCYTYIVETQSKDELIAAFALGTAKLGFNICDYANDRDGRIRIPPKLWEYTNPWINKNFIVPDEELNNPDVYNYIDGPDHFIELYLAVAKFGSPGISAKVIRPPQIDIQANGLIGES